jgi:hypothetical protein
MQDKRIWDTVPLSKSLPTDHPIRKIMSKSASKWKWATERVMFFKEGKVFIQSVTAYGTGMFLLQCDSKMGESVSNVQVVQNFDWKHKVSVMSPCLPKPELRIDLLQAGPCKAPHILSFGPTRITKGYTKTEQVTSTRNQMYHTDGPKTFDNRQFGPDGSILSDAPAATLRNATLGRPDSISALFSFFICTFIGLRPYGDRVAPTAGFRLHATIGTAVIFLFDLYHQACILWSVLFGV